MYALALATLLPVIDYLQGKTYSLGFGMLPEHPFRIPLRWT